MARELSLEEFVRIFGTTPDKYEQKFPNRVTPSNDVAPKPVSRRDVMSRKFGDDPNVREAVGKSSAATRGESTREVRQDNDREPAYVSDAQRLARANGRELTGYEQAIDSINAPLEQGQKNVVAGILALPSSVGGMFDLVRKGVPAVAASFANDTSVADEFMSRVLPPEAIKNLEDAQIEAIENFRTANPNASEQDIAAFAKEYSNSDEFYNKTLEQLPGGFALAQRGQNWANETVGLGKRADQMSAGDEAMQIIGGAAVGLPAGVVSKLTRPVVSAIGEKVANNVATRIAARAVEAVTPATLPLTPGNVALNAGIGVGVNEAIRGYQGQDTLVDYANLYDPDKSPAPEAMSVATGLAVSAIFGLPGISNIIRREAEEQIGKRIGQSAGPTLEAQSDALKPQLSPLTGLADQNAPVKKAANQFKAPDDTETVPLLDAAMSAASTTNRVESVNNALNYGILDGIDQGTVPFADIRNAYDRFSPEVQDLWDKYFYATQRKQDSTIYEQSLISQIRSAQANVQSANLSGNRNAQKSASERLVKLQQQYNALQVDDPSSRSMMVNWTRQQVDDYIRAGDQVPEIREMNKAARKLNSDIIEYERKNGLISDAEAARRLQTRELYGKLQERAHPNATGLKRRALLFKDKVANAFKDPSANEGTFVNTASRNITGEGAKVNNPKSAIVALQESIMESVRNVSANNARREVIDTLASLPNAKGTLLRPYEFKTGNGSVTHSISPQQYATLYPKGIPNEDDYVKVFRNGKIELWEFGDKSITQSLRFAPIAAVPIANATRKAWQQGTTGIFAPWFAAKTFLWDAPLAQTTKNAGRSLGLLDTFARRLFQGTTLQGPVNAAFDYGIPGLSVIDAMAAAGVAVPYQMGLRAARAVGEKIANDLATNSGVLGAIAQTPAGANLLRWVGTSMATAFDQSALAVMSRHMSTSISHLNDAAKISDDYAKVATRNTGVVRTTLNAMKAAIDSIHMASRTAFFANNYGLLKAKYRNKIPANELKKLVQETRNLTGDMSRQSNSRTVQKITSVIPYSNAMIQGTRHLLSAAIPNSVAEGINAVGGNVLSNRNTRFWSQFTGGVLLPALGSASLLSQWKGAEDYWYNRTPKWKQMTSIPFPTAEAMEIYLTTGEFPKFDPKFVNEVPLSPEFALVLEPAKAGLRALGMIGSVPTKIPGQWSQQVKDVMDQVTSFSTPPILSAIFAANNQRIDMHGLLTGQGGTQPINPIPGGGAQADQMTTNSDIPAAAYNVIGAIAGSAAQLAMQSLNVFDITAEETGDYLEAFDQALDTAVFEGRRRLPAITVPGVFDARTRLYASTPEAEYVYKTQGELEPIIGSGRQISVENNDDDAERQIQLGLVPAQKLRDPNLKALSQMVYDNLKKKGPYKEAAKASSNIRKDLQALEASRYKVPDDKYNKQRNDMIERLQQHTRTQSEILQNLERQVQKQIGRRFLQQYGVPFSYKNLSDLVKKDVAQ